MAEGGIRTDRDCSLTFLATSFWIHHIAYVEKRNPNSGSNFSVARVNPMIPCWHASWNWMELADWDVRIGDFFTAWRATVMTRRKLASINAALARWERRICCFRLGTVWLVALAHCANVGGLFYDVVWRCQTREEENNLEWAIWYHQRYYAITWTKKKETNSLTITIPLPTHTSSLPTHLTIVLVFLTGPHLPYIIIHAVPNF